MTQPYRDLGRIFTRRPIRSFDRRIRTRFLSISRFVKVEHAGNVRLARCRNISDGGAKLDVRMRLPVGDHVKIVFSPREVVGGKVAWSERNEHGIAFDELIDCVQILSGLGSLADRELTRAYAR